MFKKLIIFIFLVILVGLFLLLKGKKNLKEPAFTYNPAEKVYVAVEGEGKIAVIDPIQKSVVKNISLEKDHEGGKIVYAPHNIQVSPDGATVWVTANAKGHTQNHSLRIIPEVFAHVGGEDGQSNIHVDDEVIVIDTKTDEIIQRIPTDSSVHLAHVVLTPNSDYAYVTAQLEGRIYKINAKEFRIESTVKTLKGSEPHGIRISHDGTFAAVAFLNGKSLGILDTKSEKISYVPVDGQAVQSAITLDNKFAFVSLYDSKKIAVYDINNKSTKYITLPKSSKGPVQIYPTPDSQFLYVADQGYYFNQPQSNLVYKIDIANPKVIKEITTGDAPHGVVVSKDGNLVYITNLLSGDVSIIDAISDLQLEKIPVGIEPNGISIWSKTSGGTQ